jgi:hypothetical protein
MSKEYQKLSTENCRIFLHSCKTQLYLAFYMLGLQARSITLCVGKTDNLYSRTVFTDGVSLPRHHTNRFSSNSFGVALY